MSPQYVLKFHLSTKTYNLPRIAVFCKNQVCYPVWDRIKVKRSITSMKQGNSSFRPNVGNFNSTGTDDQTKVRQLKYNTIEARQESKKILRQAYQLEELALALEEAANSNGRDHIIYPNDHGAECICLDGKSGFEYDPSQDYLVTKTA